VANSAGVEGEHGGPAVEAEIDMEAEAVEA